MFRTLQNLKVLFRSNKNIYKIALVLYSPIRFIGYLKWKKYATHLSKKTILELEALKFDEKKVFYFGIPTHENLGDAAQYYCIKKWLNLFFSNLLCVEVTSKATYSNKVRNLLKQKINDNDFLIFESGATFCNRHEDHPMHRFILENFRNNKILFMPQTVDLSDKGQLPITASLFNKCSKALFLARDAVSLLEVRKEFDNKRTFLFPDIVTTLIGNYPKSTASRDGILLCKRIDGENKYSDNSFKPYINRLEKKYGTIQITDTNFTHSYEYTMNNLEQVIFEKLNFFSKYKVLITDRYHGMIFSLISNTPVVVLGTTGHKVIEGANWFKKIYPNSIFFCNTLDEVEDTVDYILNNNVSCQNESYFKEEYFDKLIELI